MFACNQLNVLVAARLGRFVESFNRTIGPGPYDGHLNASRPAPRRCFPTSSGHKCSAASELWLVFRDEGVSLGRFLYSHAPVGGGSTMEQPSNFWHRMRVDEAGPGVMREIALQMLRGVAEAHRAGVTHRDIKPSNLIVDVHGSSLRKRTTVKLADFGSALDAYAVDALYPHGPSHKEESHEYRPPEVRLPHVAGHYAVNVAPSAG